MSIRSLGECARFAGFLLFAAALGLQAGCDSCGTSQVTQSGGRLAFDGDAVDFGYVIVGQQKEVKLKLRNEGLGSLNIRSIDQVPGFPDEIRYSPAHLQLEPGEEQVLTLLFQPTAEGLRKGTLLLRNDGVEDPVSLPVRGVGIRTHLVLDPATVDFGPVIVDDVAEKTATLTNAGDSPVELDADPLGGGQPELFRVTVPGSDQRHLTLAAGAKVDLDLSFQPTTTGDAAAQLTWRPCPSCDPTVLQLKGKGVAAGLVPDPEPLDFGVVLPQTTATKTLTFKNIGSRSVGITSMQPAQAGTAFAVVTPAAWPTIAPGAQAGVQVTYSPTAMGPDSTSLVVKTDDPRSPELEVTVQGYGGGPSLLLVPSGLEYGVVAIGFPVTRRLVIANAGLNDPSSDKDQLVVDAISLPAGDFSYDVAGGGSLPLKIDPGQRAVLEVTYAPSDMGGDSASLELHTNDVAHPTAEVPLHGEGKLLPPCDYELVPAASPGLQFGVVQRGRSERLSFSLRNVGVSQCAVGKIEVDPNGSPAFTLPDGPVYGQLLDPGAQLVTNVDFSPPGSDASGTDYAGAIDVGLDSNQAPTQALLLSGRGAEVCLSITPTGVDFGVVKPDCETNDRKFTLYNACQTPVNVTSIAPGQASDEFRVLTGRLIDQAHPLTLAPQADFDFTARYRPANVGLDTGTIEVYTDQTVTGNPPQPYVLTLQGTGEEDARVTEDFTQAHQRKADILFVVDDSGSMDNKQVALATNFSSFMTFALDQQIDYHVAVTTTGVDDTPPYGGSVYCEDNNAANGQFMPLGAQDRIVTPELPDPLGTFARNIHVGAYGCPTEQGLEGMYAALSDPNVNGVDAGFLRPDAYLSVIIVSDAEDQSLRPLNFYSNFIENVKGPRGANLVSVSAIVNTDQSICDANHIAVDPQASGDVRYAPIVQQTGGVLESICTEDWSTSLQKLGLIAFGYKSRFILSSDPDPATLTVSINGTDVPAGPLWSYTADTRSVDFLPTAIPPPGSQIEVSYAVACNP